MRNTIIVIGYETSYLEEKIKSLGYSVYPINYYKNKNIQQLSIIKLRQINRELRKKSDRISFIYASGLENRPNLYNFLEKNFHNMGNSLNFLYRCGFVYNFKKEITRAGMEVPKMVKNINHNQKNKYIFKPKNSCGGYDISFSRPKTEHYIQEFIPGTTYSINFFVCNQKFTFLGFNKQYHLKKFDNHPFVHAGACNIRSLHYSRKIKKSIEKLSKEMNLKGFNSIDFKVYKKIIYLLDINPRITSTFKIYNDFYNNDLLKYQLSINVKHEPKYKTITKNYGFVHIFSKKNLIYKNMQLLSNEIMNVPESGEIINHGNPIFTIFTSDINDQKLREKLRKKITMTKDIYNCYDIVI